MTKAQFRKKLLIRTGAAALIFLTASAMLIYRLIIIGDAPIVSRFGDGYSIGVFGGLIGAGLATLIRTVMVLKNKTLFEQHYLAETDERNRQIALQSWAWAGYISVFVTLITTLFVPAEMVRVLLILMCVPIFIYFIMYLILQKKM